MRQLVPKGKLSGTMSKFFEWGFGDSDFGALQGLCRGREVARGPMHGPPDGRLSHMVPEGSGGRGWRFLGKGDRLVAADAAASAGCRVSEATDLDPNLL